jgi:hypothetical protein
VVRIPQQDSAKRAFNKLARTFAAQVETLKRYRGGGEQTMPRGIATARGQLPAAAPTMHATMMRK